MKDRILEYLDAFARGENNALALELQGELSMDAQTFQQHSQAVQATLLHRYDNFAISTIDAFFQKVIRAFTREAGLVGDYRLEVDQDAVLQEVIDNLIDELGENKELTDWVVDFAKENLENERSWDVRFSLIDFAREIFREEFKEIEDDVTRTTSTTGFFKDLRTRLWSEKNAFLQEVARPAYNIIDIVKVKGWDVGDFSYGKNSGLFTFIGQFATQTNLSAYKPPSDRIRNYFTDAANWPNKKSERKTEIASIAALELVPDLLRILDCYDKKFAAALSAEIALKNMYVFGLIADISRKLKDYKDENNLMLLADAPRFLNGVIRDSDTPFIYEKVGSFYRNYLIDEFQDTSGLQWKNFQPLIVNSLDQGYQSLVVGDVKQAIYRWRGGDLTLLQEKIIAHVGPSRVHVDELDNNFRSAGRIVSFNNALFKAASTILSLESGPLSSRAYEDVTQKIARAEEGVVEVEFIHPDHTAAGESGMTSESAWRKEAMRRVPKMLEKIQEHGAQLRDIAILVRKNDEGQQIASYLLEYKNSAEAKPDCSYDVISNESLRVDGAATVNLLLGAMRYLLNTDDSIARAQLGFEFARIHEPGRGLSDVFAVSNQHIFENNLPPQFTKQKLSLKKLPLMELTETLIGIFQLGHISGELVYLQAFQDLVLEFSNRERNDLGAFLEWWEGVKDKKSIQISGEVNAVQILTIHKSKGLQFPYVIIPFCSWNLDHEKWQAPNLWVRSEQKPFDTAGYLPVRYGKNLEDTFFAGFYARERTKVQLDNLNLLYVAFTRAETGLIAFAPSPETRGVKGTIAFLLYQSMDTDDSLRLYWNETKTVWSQGAWEAPTAKKQGNAAALQLDEYLSSPWRSKLVIRQSGSKWFQDAADLQRDKRDYGIHMHAVLSRMQYADDLERMLASLIHEGTISIGERDILNVQLDELLTNEKIAGWFSRDWDVRTEVPVIVPDGDEYRIDRLLLRDKKAVIVDFKTGKRKKADEKQVADYMEILRRMNFIEVEGYVLYLGENAIVEVKSNQRIKLVQRIKDRDQLNLGF